MRNLRCEVCENKYDKAFQVIINYRTHTFDCFECAIHALAPVCAHCGCKIIGHGAEAEGKIYCGARCAKKSGHLSLSDRDEGSLGRSSESVSML